MTKEQARKLQTALVDFGYLLAIDGDWGPLSKATLARFIADNRVRVNGIEPMLSLLAEARKRTPDPGYTSTADKVNAAKFLTDQGIEHAGPVIEHFAGLSYQTRQGPTLSPDALVAEVTTWFFDRDVRETSPNRSTWVDAIVTLGGGTPENASPWCARFVGACRTVSAWLAGPTFPEFPMSGGAIRTYQKAHQSNRLTAESASLDAFPIGASFHRLRTSLPDKDVAGELAEARSLRGAPQGHTGIIVGRTEHGDLLCISGNSSGSGHSGGRGGRVAYEVIGPNSSPQAAKAYARLVGVSFVQP